MYSPAEITVTLEGGERRIYRARIEQARIMIRGASGADGWREIALGESGFIGMREALAARSAAQPAQAQPAPDIGGPPLTLEAWQAGMAQLRAGLDQLPIGPIAGQACSCIMCRAARGEVPLAEVIAPGIPAPSDAAALDSLRELLAGMPTQAARVARAALGEGGMHGTSPTLCLLAWLARAQGLAYEDIRSDAMPAIEMWMIAHITLGMTPQNNPRAALLDRWLSDWIAEHPAQLADDQPSMPQIDHQLAEQQRQLAGAAYGAIDSLILTLGERIGLYTSGPPAATFREVADQVIGATRYIRGMAEQAQRAPAFYQRAAALRRALAEAEQLQGYLAPRAYSGIRAELEAAIAQAERMSAIAESSGQMAEAQREQAQLARRAAYGAVGTMIGELLGVFPNIRARRE